MTLCFEDLIREHVARKKRDATGTVTIASVETVQKLWSGYGQLKRIWLQDGRSYVVKHITPPHQSALGTHPHGWHSDNAFQRKLKSYNVESHWYQHWYMLCDHACRVPSCLGIQRQGSELLLLLEDLNATGFARRYSWLSPTSALACLNWLASFHALFYQRNPRQLWPQGSYWHLQTRTDELNAMPPSALREAAGAIDQRLRSAEHKTIIHGDAKVANFCFPDDSGQPAAVDFQYAGGGCGATDVAYFLGSCLDDAQLQQHGLALQEHYLAQLQAALHRHGHRGEAVCAEWRKLFPLAWADFHRFMLGWKPGHRKLNSFSESMVASALRQL